MQGCAANTSSHEADYIRYYNNDINRLHTTNQDMSLVKCELSQTKVSRMC